MSKIKNIAMGLGVVAGINLSILPMTAFADQGDYAQASKDLPVNLVVNDVIGMTIKSYTSSTNPATLNGTTECDTYDDGVANCTTTGDQEVRTSILPGQVDNNTMYSEIYVSTNATAGYTLKLIDADEVTNLVTTSGATIATISSEPAANNPGWAVYTVDGSTTSSWQAMPNNVSATDPTIVAGTPITVANYTPATPTVTHERMSTVHYGVAAASDQANGIYSDTVIYTATAK